MSPPLLSVLVTSRRSASVGVSEVRASIVGCIGVISRGAAVTVLNSVPVADGRLTIGRHRVNDRWCRHQAGDVIVDVARHIGVAVAAPGADELGPLGRRSLTLTLVKRARAVFAPTVIVVSDAGARQPLCPCWGNRQSHALVIGLGDAPVVLRRENVHHRRWRCCWGWCRWRR